MASIKVCIKGDRVHGFGIVANAHGRVTQVLPGTAAESAGIAPFDRIVAINGASINADPLGALAAAVRDAEARCSMELERPPESIRSDIADKENREGSSPYATRPAGRSPRSSPRTPPALASERRVILHRSAGESLGVAVTKRDMHGSPLCVLLTVDRDSPAEKAGLLPGDVLLSVEGKELKGSLKTLLERPRYKDATQITLTVRHATLDSSSSEAGCAKISVSDTRVASLTANL